ANARVRSCHCAGYPGGSAAVLFRGTSYSQTLARSVWRACSGLRPNIAGRSAALERLIDGDKHLPDRELVHALAAPVQMAFAAELLAWQARQRVLHHPYIAALLNGAGVIPRLREAADWPGADQARAGRTVNGNGRATAGSGKVRDRSIRPDIDSGAGQQSSQLGPVKPAIQSLNRWIGGRPQSVEIGALGRIPRAPN